MERCWDWANSGVYSYAAQQITAENFGTVRVDHKLGNSDSLDGIFQIDRATGTLPDPLNTVLIGQKTGQTFVTLEEDHTFSTHLLNSVRLGYNRSTAFTGGGLSAMNPAAQGAATSAVPPFDAPLIQPAGITFFGGGVNNQSKAQFAWNSYQVYDDAILTKGKHSYQIRLRVRKNAGQLPAAIQRRRTGGIRFLGRIC